MKLNKLKLLLVLVLLPVISSPVSAAGTEGSTLESVIKLMIAVTAFLVALVMWLVLVYAESNDPEGEKFLAPFRSFFAFMTRSTPVSKEEEILLSHDYDGIRELDNKIPPWFSAMFYGTILFAVIYLVNYHIIGSGNVQEEEYLAEVRQAAIEKQILTASGALIDEETVKFVDDPGALASGEEIYVKNCAACHAVDGGGLVGPNFTDDYWIHGGSIKDIFRTIKYGVPQKGMISWESQLSPNQMQDVASYIKTLVGTTPANPKAPEGTIWKDDTSETESIE